MPTARVPGPHVVRSVRRKSAAARSDRGARARVRGPNRDATGMVARPGPTDRESRRPRGRRRHSRGPRSRRAGRRVRPIRWPVREQRHLSGRTPPTAATTVVVAVEFRAIRSAHGRSSAPIERAINCRNVTDERFLTLKADHAKNIPVFAVKESKNRSFDRPLTR